MLINLVRGREIGSSWFIIALFVVEVIAFFLHKLDMKVRLPIVAVLAAGGFILNYYIEEQFFWNIPAALIGLLFFESGTLLKSNDMISKIVQDKRILALTCFACLSLSAVGTIFNSEIDMWHTKYGNVGLFLTGAYSGTLIIFLISLFLEKKTKHIKKPIIFYGKNTLPIIEYHWLILTILEPVFSRVFGLAYNNNRFAGTLEAFVYVAVCLIIMIPVILFFNRWLPRCVGKKPKKEFFKLRQKKPAGN